MQQPPPGSLRSSTPRPTLHGGATAGEALRQELSGLIVTLGAPFRLGKVWFVEALPKTRSAKVMRRMIQAIAWRG